MSYAQGHKSHQIIGLGLSWQHRNSKIHKFSHFGSKIKPAKNTFYNYYPCDIAPLNKSLIIE
jgi:hypothetical protein